MSEPYIPFYPADYLADTMHLTLEEHGAYLKLLMVLWRAGGWLEDDDKKISVILGVGIKKWKSLKPSITPFFAYEEGRFCQLRLSRERILAAEKRQKCSISGSAGGKAKAMKNNKTTLAVAINSLENQSSESLASRAVLRTPEPEPYSDTNVSAEIDFKKIVFDEGLKFLAARTGRPAEKLRPLVAKWCHSRGDPAVASALIAAQKASAVDPISFIENQLSNKNATTSKPHIDGNNAKRDARQSSFNALYAAGAEYKRKQHEPGGEAMQFGQPGGAGGGREPLALEALPGFA